MSNFKFFKELATYLLHILLRTIVGTRFLWTDIYTKKCLRITVIRPIGVTPIEAGNEYNPAETKYSTVTIIPTRQEYSYLLLKMTLDLFHISYPNYILNNHRNCSSFLLSHQPQTCLRFYSRN